MDSLRLMRPVSPSISIIVPTLNEAENIEGIIARILTGGATLDMEIIVVDDGSRDETQAIVTRLSETQPVVLLARDKPKDGLAGAVLAGARDARAGVILVIDADGSHPPEKIPELAGPVIRGEKDMVIGSRYAPGGSTPGWSRKRRLMSRAASACAWPLTDVHDALSGFFAVHRDLLAGIPSDAAGFKIALEVLVRGGDSIRVGEVPIAFRDRELGQSKMGSGVILTYFRRLLALSGWRESQDSVRLAIGKTFLVWLVDFAFFAFALSMGAGLNGANLIGFAIGASLNGWLKMTQMPAESRRNSALMGRLVFVSLLAFFLRGGILGTFAYAMSWPGMLAILPAIVVGWTVLFLGYALFIWPVREQYGTGVRWRVAAMGATAYLLALRIAYLHTTHAVFSFSAILRWCLAAWFVFDATQRLFNKTTAFRSLLLFSVLPGAFWLGSVLSADTIMVTTWAATLWLISLTAAWKWRLAIVGTVISLIILSYSGGLLPILGHNYAAAGFPGVLKSLAWQILLLTPVAIVSLARFLKSPNRFARPSITMAALICSAVATVGVIASWYESWLGTIAGTATWLPLIPLIAAEMERPDERPDGSWGAVLYGCIILYGGYFYWLAFASSR